MKLLQIVHAALNNCLSAEGIFLSHGLVKYSRSTITFRKGRVLFEGLDFGITNDILRRLSNLTMEAGYDPTMIESERIYLRIIHLCVYTEIRFFPFHHFFFPLRWCKKIVFFIATSARDDPCAIKVRFVHEKSLNVVRFVNMGT